MVVCIEVMMSDILDFCDLYIDILVICWVQLCIDEMLYLDLIFFIFSFVYESVVQVVVWFFGEELGNVYLCFINFMVCVFE